MTPAEVDDMVSIHTEPFIWREDEIVWTDSFIRAVRDRLCSFSLIIITKYAVLCSLSAFGEGGLRKGQDGPHTRGG
jgi:hypothetical protein